MTGRVGRAVSRAGLREYYDPFTGTGMGAKDFSWSALVMELLQPDPAACASHLPVDRPIDALREVTGEAAVG